MCSHRGHILFLCLSVPSHLPPFLARHYRARACSETSVTRQHDLFSCHSLPTLGTFHFKARASQLVRFSLAAFRADAVSTRACSKTASSATTGASPPTSPCSRPLAFWSCSISSRHFHHLLFLNWSSCYCQTPEFVARGGCVGFESQQTCHLSSGSL